MRGPEDSSSSPLTTSMFSTLSSSAGSPYDPPDSFSRGQEGLLAPSQPFEMQRDGSTVNGVLIGLLSSFGSAMLIALIVIVVYFFKYTAGGRILLDRIGRPGEYDDEQAFLREEAEALEEMDDLQRMEYLRAKGRPEKQHTHET
jgi:hypothetical protein